MPSSTTRTVGPAVNTIDASALESLEAIDQRLRACLKSPRKRRVRARGLQEMAESALFCRPGPMTGRILKHALKDGGITLHLSEVKGPVMDRLKRSHFLEELTGKVHLTQYDAVFSINPKLTRSTLEAQRVSSEQ